MGHSLCHNPLDIVGIEGWGPYFLRLGAVYRQGTETHIHRLLIRTSVRGDHSHPLS